jgi:putative ABC transport system permease protein
MRTSLVWHNLVHHRVHTGIGVAGVGFAVMLVFMQLGFLGCVEATATRIYGVLDFDLLIRSAKYLHFANPRTFPRSRLYQAAGFPPVREVVPLYVEINSWRHPVDGTRRGILTIGMWPHDGVFTIAEIQQEAGKLTNQECLLIDRHSRTEFGPRNGRRFSNQDIGTITEVADKRVRIVGHFALGTGLGADGAVLVNPECFCRLLPGRELSDVSLGLVRLRDGVDAEAVATHLRNVLPTDVTILTRAAVIRAELKRWVRETSIGLIFTLGVIVSLVVGMAIVYQVLSADIVRHMRQYATLKAMGYSGGFLAWIVIKQSQAFAILGFVLGIVLAGVFYRFTSFYAQVPIVMDNGQVGRVLILTLGMCALSGLVALRKLTSADPADLF